MPDEAPCGGLAPLGVHAIDGMIDLCGDFDHVFCQSFARVVTNGTDDTTSMLFRMKAGMSGYLGTITTTGPGFSFQVFGSKGWVTARRRHPCRRRVFGGAPHPPVRRLQVPADQGPAGSLAGRELRRHATAVSRPSRAPRKADRPSRLRRKQIIHGSSACESDHPSRRERQGRKGGLIDQRSRHS